MTLLEGEEGRLVRKPETQPEKGAINEIKYEELQTQISKLKRKKATGEDGIPNEAWVYADENIKRKLVDIYNKVWKGEGFPRNWRKGIIIPIYKKDDRHKVYNYRGVTLLNTQYKMYAMILEERLKEEIELKEILPENQSGFRKGRSVTDNIYTLNYAIDQELKKERGTLYVFFVDLKAAFDNINREELIKTMIKKNIEENIIRRIEDIYEETTSAVKVNGTETNEFWTKTGIRQGCPLSPTLFSIYLSDIEEFLSRGQTGGIVVGRKKIWSLAYADDIAVIAKNEPEMKSLMLRLERYLDKKKLALNTEKSKIIQFKKGGRDKDENWKWKGQKIEKVKEYKYLGYNFNFNNKDTKHIQHTVKKATVAMKQIWSLGERKFKNNFQVRVMMFDYIVKSILMYGAELWGWKEQEAIEALQIRYFKWVLGLNRNTPTYIVLEETKRQKLGVEAGRRAINYEEKVRNNTGKAILQEIWKEMTRRNNLNLELNSWETQRKTFYERHGLGTIYVEGIRQRGESVQVIVRGVAEDMQRQEQYNKIINSKYNRNYKSIMTLGMPRYLQKVQSTIATKIIARARCGNEEKGSEHWRNEEERRCRLCQQEEETLEHFRSRCPEIERENRRLEELLEDTGKGEKWLKIIQSRKGERN